jgi:hypothetical protein
VFISIWEDVFTMVKNTVAIATLAVASALVALPGVDNSILAGQDYNPEINPADFTTQITNTYFSLPVGKKMVYQAKTEGGVENIEVLITGETKSVMGVETLIVWDRVWVNGELIEDTRDYLAQDGEGNVWYFGEDVDNYEKGKLKDHDGAWLAGVTVPSRVFG